MQHFSFLKLPCTFYKASEICKLNQLNAHKNSILDVMLVCITSQCLAHSACAVTLECVQECCPDRPPQPSPSPTVTLRLCLRAVKEPGQILQLNTGSLAMQDHTVLSPSQNCAIFIPYPFVWAWRMSFH